LLKQVYLKFLVWRIKTIDDKAFLLIVSGIVGFVIGFAALALKEVVHLIQVFLTQSSFFRDSNYLYVLYPLVGILLTAFIANKILKESLGHGISNILYAISRKSSIIRRTWMYSRLITSAITVGFGGSVGLEAPIVVTGSAIGANMARFVHLGYRKRTLLIGCGTAGAIAAIFNSPVAGVIFSIEVILAEINVAAFIPLLIASVCGSLISIILQGGDILFSFDLTDEFNAADTPLYLLLGIICGFVSLYFTRTMFIVEQWIQRVKKYVPRAIVGGIGLGLIIFVFPPIYGEGYDTITHLLKGQQNVLFENSLFPVDYHNVVTLLIFMIGIVIIKPVATALTIGSGGSGGIFAPSLFIGGVTGFVFASLINLLAIDPFLSTSNFTLVAMGGVMSGVLHAPLTGIFLIAEITSGYTLFIPLMLVAAISYSTINYFEKHSFYSKKLVEEGDLIPNDKDRELLSLIHLNKIIEKDLLATKPSDTLGDLVRLVRRSRRNIFPVVDEDGSLAGVVTLDDIRDIMFNEEAQHERLVSSLMHAAPAYISSNEKMQSVMKKFEVTGAWNLPVIDDGKYVGFVSKSRIFNAYRRKLQKQTLQ
jgi:CIC family chloride channel protein